MKTTLWFLLMMGWLISVSAGQIQQSRDGVAFELEVVADKLGIPWGMAFLSPTELLFTERAGRVALLDVASGAVQTIQGAPEVLVAGQGGLLDVAVPPDFSKGDWIYFTFVRDRDDEGVTVLARAHLRGGRLVDWQDLLETRSATDTGYHFGSRIAFDDEDHVYFGIGDRGERANSQDLSNHAGTVLRLRRSGAVPADNPFRKQSGALPEIWSYGHRNPQGTVYDRERRRLWVIEHGPRGGDEINLVLPGRNYGWPVISYGKEYWGPVAVGEGTHKAGMEQPVKVYTPSIAPGSLLLYTGAAFPAWRGNLFTGALKLQHLNRVGLDKEGKAVVEERLLTEQGERIRALALSPEGWIYLSTDSGKILRMKPARR